MRVHNSFAFLANPETVINRGREFGVGLISPTAIFFPVIGKINSD
jgi:hypothetical protein